MTCPRCAEGVVLTREELAYYRKLEAEVRSVVDTTPTEYSDDVVAVVLRLEAALGVNPW